MRVAIQSPIARMTTCSRPTKPCWENASQGSPRAPFDPSTAGGNAYDLAEVGLTHARYVRIVDRTEEACPEAGPDKPITNGFDLDAIAIVNAELP